MTDNQALQLKVRDVILQSLTAKTSQDLINEEGKNSSSGMRSRTRFRCIFAIQSSWT